MRFVEGLDARGQRRIAQDENGRAVFAGDARGFDRDVKTIFHGGSGENDARAVAVPAVDRLEKIALLDVRGQAGARPAALDINNNERHLGHGGPADRLGLKRNAGAGAAGDGEIAGEGEAESERDGAELVLGLDKDAAVFRQLAPQNFHDRRPGRDRITGAVTNAGGDEAVGEGGVAVHGDLGRRAGFIDLLELVKLRENIADGITVAGLERHQGGVDDALVFAGELFANQRLQLLDVEVENFRDQAEDENVFALVLGGAAERFDGEAGDGDADVDETFVVKVGLNVIGIVKENAAVFQEPDVVLVAVLIKRDEEIGFVAGRQHFAGAHADLENGWAAGDGGGNRHVGHDFLGAPAGEPGEERAGALDAVLRIAGETNNGVVDVFRTQICPVSVRRRTGGWRCRARV